MMDDTKQTIALLGDIMMTRSVSVFREPEYLKMRDMLNAADAVFANFEACAHPYLEDAHQQRLEGGSYVTTEPALLKDLKWLGVNMVAAGSGHADDYGVKGIFDTMRYLDEAGIVHAGRAAISRKRARQPTSKRRPGASRLSRRPASSEAVRGPAISATTRWAILASTVSVTSKSMRSMRQRSPNCGRSASASAGIPIANGGVTRATLTKKSAADTYNFLGKTFRLGNKFAIKTAPNPTDLRENVRQVKHARSQADRVIASFHGHEQGGDTLLTAKRRTDIEDIADFTLEYGRRCIEAGADISSRTVRNRQWRSRSMTARRCCTASVPSSSR